VGLCLIRRLSSWLSAISPKSSATGTVLGWRMHGLLLGAKKGCNQLVASIVIWKVNARQPKIQAQCMHGGLVVGAEQYKYA